MGISDYIRDYIGLGDAVSGGDTNTMFARASDFARCARRAWGAGEFWCGTAYSMRCYRWRDPRMVGVIHRRRVRFALCHHAFGGDFRAGGVGAVGGGGRSIPQAICAPPTNHTKHASPHFTP